MLAGELGEEALIQELRSLFAVTAEHVPVAIGDDAAVIEESPGRQMVWTTDLLLEGIHFRKDWFTPRQLGRKSLAVNLSDIAAMGALPRYALLSLACARETEVEYILELARGLCELAVEYGVAVIGGDTTASEEGLILSVTAGGLADPGKALLRSGARPGDSILMTGFLGSAAGGLKILDEGITDGFSGLREAFISPRPGLSEAALAVRTGASAMTDLSDGLSSDMRHICQSSSVGADIDHDRLPVHPELIEAAERYGWDLESLIMTGGEDYGLLFTVPAEKAQAAARAINHETGTTVSTIGEITVETTLNLYCEYGRLGDLPPHGFDHFKSS